MEMAKQQYCFLFPLLQGAFVLFALVYAQDQQDFISIDCGASEDYTDETTGINYSTDDNYIETGVNKIISPEFNTKSLYKRFSNVRSFPEENRNCYTLRPIQGRNHSYLIRASFMYGNYDAQSQLPEFDLYLGVNKWNTVKLKDASSLKTFEIIHVPQSDYIHVCLVNTDSGTPFISALELRLLNNDSYVTQSKSESLELFARVDCGLSPYQIVRYKDDSLDRIWSPWNDDAWEVLNSSFPVTPNSYLLQPSLVMSTVVTPKNANESGLKLHWSSEGNVPTKFYIYFHFTEIIKDLQINNQTRGVNIFLNNKIWYGPFSLNYLKAETIYSVSPTTGSDFVFWINKTDNSTLPPLLSALEIFTVKQLVLSQTDHNDVDVIMNIKSFYGLKIKNWQGDPCGPSPWNGLNCSSNDFDPPRIVSLNLSSGGLTGNIAPYISDLALIQILDLSNNNLTGMIPDFLSHMPHLRVLNLQHNNLSGTLPLGLYEKSKNGTILLSVDENPNLCLTNACDEKKDKRSNQSVVIPVASSVGGFLVVLFISVAIFYALKRRKKAAVPSVTTMNVEFNIKKDEDFKQMKKQQFTYSEVLGITNNFERVIGKGGFGTVYYGYLNNSEVAVKILSCSSAQGFKEFHAEAKLLTRVHHRNLTSLVGYCDEGPIMGLIYEYMSNGDLAWQLSDRNPHPLNWEERLKISIDAAQGLEYLHNGCKPPIIHRDVKSTNILLNGKLHAKLADFGLSKAFPGYGDDSHVSTVVVGTPGYLDPEYYVSNRLTEKSDVFSFGVVLLETITGRRAIKKNAKIKDQKGHIIKWVDFILSNGDIDNIVDPRLDKDFHKNSVWKAVEVAMACASPTSTRRPTMIQVVMELKQCLAMEMKRTRRSDVTESSELPEMFINNERDPQSR